MQTIKSIRSLLTCVFILCAADFSFAQTEKQTAYGIFLDNSASLMSQLKQVKTLGNGLVQYARNYGPVSVFSFTSQGVKKPLMTMTGVEWSRDEGFLSEHIDTLSIEGGDSALLDAIHAIAEKITTKANSEKEPITSKVIILVTDGEERASRVKEKQLIKELQDSGIKVYAIGLVRELGEERHYSFSSPKEKAESRLKKLTKETGGRVVFLKSESFDLGNVIKKLFTVTNK
jgi:Mg-chelatase subunit ChlD